MIDLAYRSGNVSTVQAHTVYENDTFEYELGLEPKLKHVPALGDRGAAKYFYAVFRTKDNGYGFNVMTVDDVRRHAARYSKAYNSGPWQTNFEEMAKKTVLKRTLKYAPLKTEFVRGVAADETVKSELSDDMFLVPDETISVEYTVMDADEDPGEAAQDGAESDAPPAQED